MDCMITKLNEKDQFISKIKDSDSKIGQFYHFDAMQEKSYSERLSMSNNGREVALAQVIKNYMSDLTLTEKQLQNISLLSEGAKVIIGGQQAGLFGGPLYTFHKIFSSC